MCIRDRPTPPADTTPPTITNITPTVTYKTAKITWTTSEASDSQIEYGLTTSYGKETPLDPSLVTTHTQNLPDLTPGTTYHFLIKSKDQAGNVGQSDDTTLQTTARLAKPPKPTGSFIFTPGSINLAWSSLDYELCSNIGIYRDSAASPSTPDPTKLLVTLPCTDVTYHDRAVTSGTTYYYSLFTIDDLGVYSDPLSGSYTAPVIAPETTNSSGSSSSSGGGGSFTTPNIPPVTIPPTTNTLLPLDCTGAKFSVSTGKPCPATSTTPASGQRIYNFGTVTLRNGSQGEAVKELQRFLNYKLNLGLVVDGKLGPKTIGVIKAWQRNNGLVPDGLIGPKTKAMMNAGA